MRIIYMGTPDFAVPALEALAKSEHDVVAVVTQPDKARDRGKKVQFTPVKEKALEYDIPVYQPEKVKTNEEFYQQLVELAPDLIVVAAYGKILPLSILELPKYGCVNIHASLLPKYRGAAPIHRSIINGDKTTGVTLMYMAEGMDTGDMILKGSLPIEPDDTYGKLHDKLAPLGGQLLLEALEQIEAGTAQRVPQNEAEATHVHMIKNSDAGISFAEESARVISCKIRGYDPAPGAFAFLGEEKIKLFASVYVDDSMTRQPGEIIGCDKHGLLVQGNGGTMRIREVQLSGKKRMSAADCFRGKPQLLNERFK